MKNFALKFSALFVAQIFGDESGFAQNLLPNGDFSAQQQVSGWTAGDGSIAWSSDDMGNSSSSGSLSLSTSMTSVVRNGSAFTSCFAVSSGSAYTIGGASRVTAGGGTGNLNCSTYSDTACTTSRTHLSNATFTGGSNWTATSIAAGTLPDDAHSANCFLLLVGSGSAQSSAMEFDGLFFNSTAPMVPVRLLEFGVD